MAIDAQDKELVETSGDVKTLPDGSLPVKVINKYNKYGF